MATQKVILKLMEIQTDFLKRFQMGFLTDSLMAILKLMATQMGFQIPILMETQTLTPTEIQIGFPKEIRILTVIQKPTPTETLMRIQMLILMGFPTGFLMEIRILTSFPRETQKQTLTGFLMQTPTETRK